MSSTYADLKVWRAAIDFVVGIYQRSRSSPKKNRPTRLTSQVRRGAASTRSIAEGESVSPIARSGTLFPTRVILTSRVILSSRLRHSFGWPAAQLHFRGRNWRQLLRHAARAGRMIGRVNSFRPEHECRDP